MKKINTSTDAYGYISLALEKAAQGNATNEVTGNLIKIQRIVETWQMEDLDKTCLLVLISNTFNVVAQYVAKQGHSTE